jgi:hypothetical protein
MQLRCMAGGALAACGGGASSKTIAGAAGKTLAASTVSASYDASLNVSTFKGKISFKGSGVVDNESHHSRLTVDLSSLAQESGAKSDLSAFRGEEVVDSSGDLVLYLRIPFYTQHLPASKPWLRIDYGKTLKEKGIAINSLTLDQDPGQCLEFLRGVTGKVEKVGETAVAGVQTTHYRASIFLLDYPKALTGARKTAAQHVAGRIVQLTKQSTFPTEVWIDGEGYVRRMTFTYAIPASDTSSAINYTLTLDYSRFGSEASIGLPPADEVSTPSQLKTS